MKTLIEFYETSYKGSHSDKFHRENSPITWTIEGKKYSFYNAALCGLLDEYLRYCAKQGEPLNLDSLLKSFAAGYEEGREECQKGILYQATDEGRKKHLLHILHKKEFEPFKKGLLKTNDLIPSRFTDDMMQKFGFYSGMLKEIEKYLGSLPEVEEQKKHDKTFEEYFLKNPKKLDELKEYLKGLDYKSTAIAIDYLNNWNFANIGTNRLKFIRSYNPDVKDAKMVNYYFEPNVNKLKSAKVNESDFQEVVTKLKQYL